MMAQDSDWIEHDDGPMPIGGDVQCYVRHNGFVLGPQPADCWAWEDAGRDKSNPLTAMFYRVVQA